MNDCAKLVLCLIALLASALGVVSCAPVRGGSHAATSSGAASTLPEQPYSPAPTLGDAEGATSAEEAMAPSSSPGQQERAARERPGLGTVWGEDRESRVRTAPFFREDPERPFSTLAVYYNDATGVAMMAQRSGRSELSGGISCPGARALSVSVLDDARRPLPSVRAGGRAYVVGEHGQRYTIQVRNQSPNRVEVVASVDGLDVIDGHPANYRKRGYILAPYGTLEIEGFRRSAEAVASFRFGSVRDSYAERKGEGRNVGVIGVAFFSEQGSRWDEDDEEIRRRHEADPFPARYAEPPPSW